ncbi:pyruvate:ferredoxin (flavodoxin) oxidoreductase [Geoalkalibacter halelectricus]|uniref:Pyruvate:ferredoxin oxidoreductase n=1 Tax=Geoalkalibacter halelectricus TaxID=2847045 RepID=A0ABY5ZGL6_9BACT|nr:pyruvate:ferredoxin (flavodoxin) oxidoreductase [Geoalkalibacter halelectricus]MDO3378014.1 pyruvate:ferredoxin (flavodoxin) oxidoreductase [Geoalkalibacter halelectricus]UWZ78315.1 pyruvate:ferredoxin (flavodoxin) oxidoreductase [Geoalkalibacter halelectricus]
MSKKMVTIDGNTAAAHVAHATNEVCAIYPITPSSVMGEICDAKSAVGQKNIWGTVPKVVELQSEGGAAGAVHGALQGGALTTTFTASQGLLLMIPNMYKIAGELSPTVFHVSARAIAAQGLSIFGDHSDVMSCRQTGWGMLASNNVQEVMDFACIAQAATLESRVPILHYFDGFRTSHEVQKVHELSNDDMKQMVDDELVRAHRARALSPDNPVLRGTAQNPDVYFQGRETVNKYYDAFPGILQGQMDKFAGITGRQYKLVDYVGAPDAERILVIMGSGADTVQELVEYLVTQGEKVGVLKIRMFNPFPVDGLVAALPKTVKSIAVMDRTKEPGSLGEPLYQLVRTAIGEAMADQKIQLKGYPVIVGGRYGLGSYEFSPGMAKAIFDNLAAAKPKNHFIVGIKDDVTNASLDYDPDYKVPHEGIYQAMFFGLGSDGTVGANKNSIKIIGETTDNNVQAYFVYDSKKAGTITTSHLRFGKKEIRAPYLVQTADFVACHNFAFLEKYDMLKNAKQNATFLLNSPFGKDEVWDKLPLEVQQRIIDKKLKVYVINAVDLGEKIGLGARINVIMQTAFFKISNIIPFALAEEQIKDAIVASYGKAGDKVINMNYAAVDAGANHIEEVKVPSKATSAIRMKAGLGKEAPDFVRNTLGAIIDGKGDQLPISAMPVDGTFPTDTAKWEKRNIAINIPVWDEELCIQCGICSFVCPHATIRMKIYDADKLQGAPKAFKAVDARGKGLEGKKFSLQVAPEDCTGCGSCVYNCPAKSKEDPNHKAINMQFQPPLREQEATNWDFFLSLPETDPALVNRATLKGTQLLKPLFEFSGACAGCGETPFIKLASQLFGDRMMIANATGCTSIYCGNLPTTPFTKRADGRGPTWSNSLFEDNAEFGYGMRLAVDKFNTYALELLDIIANCDCKACKGQDALFAAIKNADQSTQEGIEEQRGRVAKLKEILAQCPDADSQNLLSVADYLVQKSVWIVGGDGWAYDIGYGGLDHVLASGENVNVLVLDTEVYSNTGGQASKSTPLGAVAQFAAGGKRMPKKDLGLISMTYGNIYVAKVSLANPAQVVKAFLEADSYDGPSIIIAYSHCIAHGIAMDSGIENCKNAVNSGHWPLFRFDPRLATEGKNPLQLDSKETKISFEEYASAENRYRVLKKANPEASAMLMEKANRFTASRFDLYKKLAEMQTDWGAK